VLEHRALLFVDQHFDRHAAESLDAANRLLAGVLGVFAIGAGWGQFEETM